MEQFWTIIITALLSPLFLKFAEFVMNKNSEQAKDTRTRLDALAKRVDDLRDEKVRLEIEIGVLKSQLSTKDLQITALQRDASTFRYQLAEKDSQINNLQKEITMLQDSKQNK